MTREELLKRYADGERDFLNANLSKADLKTTYLFRSNFNGANFSEADLSQAQLTGADLAKTNLSGANLTEADLFGVNLAGANLLGANLNLTDLHEARLHGANLQEVTGLETCKGLRTVLWDSYTIWPSGFNIGDYRTVI